MSKLGDFVAGRRKKPDQYPENAQIIPRNRHHVSRKNISEAALKVLYRLESCGYNAYLVGGGVRDLLLGREPKDYDVVTNALPKQIKRCFRNARIIGRRFRLVHVIFRGEIIEVSTFRADQSPSEEDELHPDAGSNTGMVLRDNVYGTFAEDAKRRDFTVNAIYYNIADFAIIDCHQGLEDLRQGLLRMIGEPKLRYREDPVRILRAVRLAAQLGFRIAKKTAAPIVTHAHLLQHVSNARLFTEMLKLFFSGQAEDVYKLLHQYDLIQYLFPATARTLAKNYAAMNALVTNAMQDTDQRLAQRRYVSPAYLLAVLLWLPIQDSIQEKVAAGGKRSKTIVQITTAIMTEQCQVLAIPKRMTGMMHAIWELQALLQTCAKEKEAEVARYPKFRAGYDFLLLRARSGDASQKLVQRWKKYYAASARSRKNM